MEIKILSARPEQMKKKPTDESNLGFGDIVTDHMFLMDFQEGKGWFNPRIEPYHSLAIDPAAMVLHYGQEVFEGLKAYRGKDGGVYLFRARDNFIRLNRSAVRVCMPEVDVDFGVPLQIFGLPLRLDRDVGAAHHRQGLWPQLLDDAKELVAQRLVHHLL